MPVALEEKSSLELCLVSNPRFKPQIARLHVGTFIIGIRSWGILWCSYNQEHPDIMLVLGLRIYGLGCGACSVDTTTTTTTYDYGYSSDCDSDSDCDDSNHNYKCNYN